MSKFQKPCLYTGNALDNQWVNLIYTSHDLYCGCLKPLKHLEDIIKRQECRSTKDIGVGTHKEETSIKQDDFDLDAGDLEELFKEENDATG